MSEMVERVGRAIYESKLFQPARSDDPWGGKPTVTKTFCREAARAAIEAMRTPTDAMKATAPSCGVCGQPIQDWHAMIDAALSEKP